jgi:hypothetical protein
LGVAGLLLTAVGWSTAVAAAASPTPSVAPLRPPPNIQAWLDSDSITPDAPPGGIVQVGYSFWDTRQQEFFPPGEVYVRLHPKTGNAKPSEAQIDADFPGHVLATVVVPEGGVGDLEVGMLVPTCVDPGGCSDQDAPFTIAGVGPPPDARPEDLIGAEILPLVGDTVAGREFPVSVNVVPHGLWDFDKIPLPDHLVVVARHPGGAELSSGELLAPPTPGTPYNGKLSIPETGDAQIVVAVPLPNGGNREIPGSGIERTVVEGGRRETTAPKATAAPASPAPAASAGGVPPLVWVVGIGAAIAVGFVVLRRVLADL